MTTEADSPESPGTTANRAPRNWLIWRLPKRVIVYVLAVEAATLAVTAVTSTTPSDRNDWITVGVLAVCGLVHQQLSRIVERLRRDRPRTVHVGLLSVWLFAAALLVPPLPAITLVVLMISHRWWLVMRLDKSQPPHREVFNVAMLGLSVLAVIAVVSLLGQADSLTSAPGDWAALATMALAVVVHWLVNTLLLAVVLRLANPEISRREILGTLGDNLLEVSTLVLGAFVALAVTNWPPFAVLMVVPVVALHRTVLIDQLEHAAASDDKTGLLNSSTWTEQARTELAKAAKDQGSMAVLMIDLDGFKQVNDGPGHLVGDVVLQQVAVALAAAVRRSDTVGRYGGDEFVVLLPETGIAEAVLVAERCRQQIRLLYVPHQVGDDPIRLSASIGVAVHPHITADNVENLLAAADAAMYDAKGAGGDEVRLAGPQRGMPWLPGVRTTFNGHTETDAEATSSG
jgi:diguanylate cyclase (GGDEF)-like protein